ncbi:MAG: Oxidoreductase [Labilithrix sp.]|nr:Oxidoreductase [Labilithrix sp.]
MRALDVGVIGAGTAGSAAALFLARAGHRVTLYERVLDPRPVGAGITMQPTGLHVLERLGLGAAVVARGTRIDRLYCTSRDGRPLVALSYARVGPAAYGLGLHRGVLFEALHRAVSLEPRIAVREGLEITGLERTPRATWLLSAGGERHGPHELVVVCDGARSQLRDHTGTSKRAERYPWGALWFVARDTRPEPNEHAHVLRQVVDTNQRFLGLLPTGHGPGPDPGPRLVSLFWSLRCDRIDAWRAAGLDRWKAELAALAPESTFALEQITDIDQVLFASYHDVVMHRWATRSVVYLGDAAHATSPQLGQGCNLALWDAMVLADCLAAEERDVACALDAYSRARRDHLAFYQLVTRLLTPFFQGDEPLHGTLRDLGMPLLARIPLFERIMTLSMLGVIDGFTGRMLEVRPPPRPA